ncbi:MAG: hypothetical protein CMM50_04270 [Rhodospirillaceae bacterium]|nr:hypothetical protein [Rhodospirillaceae bacterium]|tara:strand:- start:1926 stop:2642 length:717 start_codon:yes stop_codon:yes gene_type:complete
MFRQLAAATVISAAIAMTAQAADVVVLESSVPGLNPGDVIDASSELVLPDGLSLTLISESGDVIQLTGPFSGVPGGDTAGAAAGDSSLVGDVAALIKSAGTDVSSLGAIRAGNSDSSLQDPWLIDVSRPGTHCAPADGAVQIWRPGPESFAVLAMRPLGADKGGRLKWPDNTAVIPWPSFMTISDGAAFDVVLDEGQPYRIDFKIVPSDLPNATSKAAWMSANGCQDQALAMLRTVLP